MAKKNWYDELDDAVTVSETNTNERNRTTGEFARDIGRAVGQGVSFGFGDEFEAFARALYAKFIDGDDFNTAYNETVKEIRDDVKEFREDEPVLAYGSEIAGAIPSAIGAGAKLAQYGVKGIMNPITQGAVYGAGAGEGNPVERVPDALLGGAVSGAVSKVLPPITEGAKKLIKAGTPVTVGQAVGGGIRKVEQALKSLPFLGDPIVEAEIRATQGFTKTAFREALKPLQKYGINLNKEFKGLETGNQLYAKAEQLINKSYQKLVPKLKFPNQSDLQPIYDDIILKQTEFLPKSVGNTFLKDMDEIVYANFGADGVLTGQGFKNIQSGLRGIIRDFSSDPNKLTRDYGKSYSLVLDALNKTLIKNNPKYAKELQDLDFSFKTLNFTIGKAVEKGGNKTGTFTPSNLMSAIRSADPSLRKSDFRKGEAVLQDLANEGQALNMTLPDSGTATRSLFTTGLGLNTAGAVGGVDPVITGALTGGLLTGYSRAGVPAVRGAYEMGVPAIRNVLSGATANTDLIGNAEASDNNMLSIGVDNPKFVTMPDGRVVQRY
tara:strand:+ start:1528 stop:3177 length:1650 start_codon:yes stop_codon:yes gene_type:complete